jgi:hypothetical protein
MNYVCKRLCTCRSANGVSVTAILLIIQNDSLFRKRVLFHADPKFKMPPERSNSVPLSLSLMPTRQPRPPKVL